MGNSHKHETSPRKLLNRILAHESTPGKDQENLNLVISSALNRLHVLLVSVAEEHLFKSPTTSV